MPRANYYNILGLEHTATREEIKSAFRKLAKQYHPDVNTTVKNTAAIFMVINNAYQVLADDKTRKEYDNYFKRSRHQNSTIRYSSKEDNSVISKALSEFHSVLWDIDDILKKITPEDLASGIHETDLYNYFLFLFKFMEEEILETDERFNNFSSKKARIKLHLENYFALLRGEIDKYIKNLEPEIDRSTEKLSHVMNIKNRMIHCISEIYEFIQNR